MRVGRGGGSGTPTGRSLSRLVLVQLAPADDRDSVLVLVLRSTGVARPRAVYWRCSRSRQGGVLLDVPTVRAATGRSALGDLAGRGGGTGGALTGGTTLDVLVACLKNAGAALTRGSKGGVFDAGGGGFGLREERSRLDTRLTDLDTRLADLDRRLSRSLKESRRKGGTLSLRSLRSVLRSSRFSL